MLAKGWVQLPNSTMGWTVWVPSGYLARQLEHRPLPSRTRLKRIWSGYSPFEPPATPRVWALGRPKSSYKSSSPLVHHRNA